MALNLGSSQRGGAADMLLRDAQNLRNLRPAGDDGRIRADDEPKHAPVQEERDPLQYHITDKMAQSYADYRHHQVTQPAPFVAHVEITRPAKLNAFHEDMWLEFGAVFRQLSADPDVRAVVLTGAGERAFTAGLDTQAAAVPGNVLDVTTAADGSRKAAQLRRHIAQFQDSIGAMEKCEKRGWPHRSRRPSAR